MWARQHGQTWVMPEEVQYNPDDVLTVDQAAAFCHVEKRTIYQWHHRGLPYVPDRKHRMIRMGDLLEFEAARRRKRRSLRTS